MGSSHRWSPRGGIQTPRHSMGYFVWDLATKGFDGIVCQDPVTAVLPEIRSSHDGIKREGLCWTRLPRYYTGLVCIGHGYVQTHCCFSAVRCSPGIHNFMPDFSQSLHFFGLHKNTNKRKKKLETHGNFTRNLTLVRALL